MPQAATALKRAWLFEGLTKRRTRRHRRQWNRGRQYGGQHQQMHPNRQSVGRRIDRQGAEYQNRNGQRQDDQGDQHAGAPRPHHQRGTVDEGAVGGSEGLI